MDLDILSSRLDIWDFQVKLSSNTTPRKAVLLTSAMVFSWSCNMTCPGLVPYSGTPVARTLNGNEKLFELPEFRVIGVG